MSSSEKKKYTLKPENIWEAISKKEDFFVQFHMFSPEVDALIIKILHRYLEEFDIIYMKNTIITVLKELINNAIKANIKRLYFNNKNLNIENTEDYRKGMEEFKTEAYQLHNDEYFSLLENSKMIIRISFKASDDFIHISVINNIPILDIELEKVNARIRKAYRYKDISEAFDDVLDDSEGAGLGLIMALMLFKNSGLKSEYFQIKRKDDLTIATISIPKKIKRHEEATILADELVKELEEIPTFPDNIRKIQRLCATPDVEIKEIAKHISMDPGLTSSILKLSNSAGYITSKQTETIEDAVKIIGIKGLNTLLLATGVNDIVEKRYKKFEKIWNESYKRASYSQKIAIQMKRTKFSDFAYLSGLLADIGWIVLLSIKPEVQQRIGTITGIKEIDDTGLLEEISIGVSHSTLGAMIARKWKFNEGLVKAIEYHHRPHMAEEKMKQLVYIVYLAELFIEIENKKSKFETADEDVLAFFGLQNKKTFEKLHKILQMEPNNRR